MMAQGLANEKEGKEMANIDFMDIFMGVANNRIEKTQKVIEENLDALEAKTGKPMMYAAMSAGIAGAGIVKLVTSPFHLLKLNISKTISSALQGVVYTGIGVLGTVVLGPVALVEFLPAVFSKKYDKKLERSLDIKMLDRYDRGAIGAPKGYQVDKIIAKYYVEPKDANSEKNIVR